MAAATSVMAEIGQRRPREEGDTGEAQDGPDQCLTTPCRVIQVAQRQQRDDRGDGQKHPEHGPAQKRVAEEADIVRDTRDGAPAGQGQRDAAKQHQAAERSHERGQTEPGHPGAIPDADQHTHADSGGHRHPGADQMAGLEQGDDGHAKAHERAHGQIDFALRDHHEHAQGDHRRDGRLSHEVGHVAVADEYAIGEE
jgi:hypothetical protein